jgi:hypothetical protein
VCGLFVLFKGSNPKGYFTPLSLSGSGSGLFLLTVTFLLTCACILLARVGEIGVDVRMGAFGSRGSTYTSKPAAGGVSGLLRFAGVEIWNYGEVSPFFLVPASEYWVLPDVDCLPRQRVNPLHLFKECPDYP